ncbi:phage tail domain-containing protein [Halobacillus sp. A5]|uniref:phage tail domain-containing protein n=1 Tax=Halobacillus sp. A5 TaxID=2880263 RepID=UPI0020A6B23A|nr:phage tail domain-containing protein [Halobacillus sp. A5]MCP3025419.1 phage tail family protein [Halobacillus sp. A5]
MIKLDDKSLKEFNIIPNKGHTNPSTPSFSEKTLEIPGKDGLYYLGVKDGVRTFTFPLTIMEKERSESQKVLREFVNLFHDSRGRKRKVKLSFDYESEKYYYVRLSSDINPTRTRAVFQFDLTLTTYDGWLYAASDAYDPKTVEEYNSGLEYGEPEAEYVNQTNTSFSNSKQYVGIYNYSHYNTPFSFMIEGYVINPRITNIATGKSVSFNLTLEAGERLYFDSKLMTVWREKGSKFHDYWISPTMSMKYPYEWEKFNTYDGMSGDFLELTAEENTLLFEGGDPSAHVQFEWEHRFK